VADASALSDRPFAWRFRVVAGPVVWDDLFSGRMALDPSQTGGDFVVGRHGVGASYQLAVVADDAQMGVNQVIRGNDLVASTPRQILIYERLGWPVPRFGHVSLAIDGNGRRMAKRDGSLKLATLRKSGVDPRRLVGCLIHTCGWTSSIIPSLPADWIDHFDPASVPPRNWVVTAEWLESLRVN
jgi:glutamyl-tRNA synthetase